MIIIHLMAAAALIALINPPGGLLGALPNPAVDAATTAYLNGVPGLGGGMTVNVVPHPAGGLHLTITAPAGANPALVHAAL